MKAPAESLDRLLLRAALAGEIEAEGYWREWRARVDLEALGGESLPLLSLVGTRFSAWLEADEARAMLLGVVKRHWSENQVRLRQLARLVAVLGESGIRALVTGRAASALLASEERLTLPFYSAEVLVPLAAVPTALALWRRLGWVEDARLESRSRLHHPNGGEAVLGWRLFTRAPDVASEAERLESLPRQWMGAELRVLPPHLRLLEILIRPQGQEPLLLAWEALAVLRQPVDWRAFEEAFRNCPAAGVAQERLGELARDWGASVPQPAGDFSPRSLRFLVRLLLLDYRRWHAERVEPPPFPALGQYLKLRWRLRSLTQFPGAAVRILRSR